MTTLRTLLEDSRKKLSPLYGDGEAKWLVRIIMEHVKGWNQVELIMRADDEVSDFVIGRVNDAITKLLKGEPVQYIYGDTYWYGMTLKVTPDVLIPRPETEELVDIIVKDNQQTDLRVLDICTGSGCIAVALAKSLNFPTVTGIDISEAALDIARQNASQQKVNVSFIHNDALSLPQDVEKYDIIVSNPPYIMESEKKTMEHNVLDYEPHLALFVPDDDPLKFYKAIAEYSQEALCKNGKLYFELNPLTADDFSKWLSACGWSDVELRRDMHGKLRFIIATK